MDSLERAQKLYIHADDFGLKASGTPAIQSLIEKCYLHGVSIVANGRDTENAISFLLRQKQCKKLLLGVHLNIVEGEFLIDKQSCFDGPVKLFLLSLLGQLDFDRIKREFSAQIVFLQNKGLKIDYLDSHQHIHFIPGFHEVIIETAKQFNIKYIRLIKETPGCWLVPRNTQCLVLNYLSQLLSTKLVTNDLQSLTFNYGFAQSGKTKLEHLLTLGLNEGSIVAYFHPDSNSLTEKRNGDYLVIEKLHGQLEKNNLNL